MNKAAWIPTTVAVIACSLCIAVAQQPVAPSKIPNAAEEQLKPQPQALLAAHALPGRYQAVSLSDGGRILLIDTHTGQCWERYVHQKNWHDLGSPVIPRGQ